jgi:hypothetical protein
VRVLADMLARAEPATRLVAVVIDDVEESVQPDRERFDVVRPDELEVEDLLALAAGLDGPVLKHVLQPAVARTMLERGGGRPVVFLAPASAVYAELTGLARGAHDSGIAVIPRVCIPTPFSPGRRAVEAISSGVYDTGCFAVGWNSHIIELLTFAQTALEETALATRSDRSGRGAQDLHGGWPWLDHVVALCPEAVIIRDPGLRVGPWNLHERHVLIDAGRPAVSGAPLRTLAMAEFDPRRPGSLAAREGSADLADQPVLAELCFAYADALIAAGWERVANQPYGYVREPDSVESDAILRPELKAARLAGSVSYPPVTRKGAEQFAAWLSDPAADAPAVSRLWWAVYRARPDLQAAFPGVATGDADAYLEWASSTGVVEHGIPDDLRPARAGAGAPPHTPLVVSLRSPASSPWVSAIESALEEAEVVVDRDSSWRGVSAVGDVTLSVCGPKQTDGLSAFLHTAPRDGRRHVAFVSWELEGTTISGIRTADAVVDELWVPSEHVARGARAQFNCPVVTIPIPVEVPAAVPEARQQLGLPEGFLILSFAGGRGMLELDNPFATLKAFAKMGQGTRPSSLVLAVGGPAEDPGGVARLRAAAAEVLGVIVLENPSVGAVLSACDCVLSMHRAGSFVPHLAQSAGGAKPIVATRYAGSMEYLRDDYAYLVNAVIRPVETLQVWNGDLVWADPDVEHAAALLTRVRDRPHEAKERAQRGAAIVHARFSMRASAEAMRARLAGQARPQLAAVISSTASQM